MIESKILGSAVGIQRGDVIDRSETTVLPSLANGVIAGCFKRGRMDKPFKVTSDNYKALLGYDPSNPNYLAVEDAFKRGVSEISILRVGGHESGGGDGGGGSGGDTAGTTDITFLKIKQKILGATGGIIGRIGMVYSIGDTVSAGLFESPTSSGATDRRGVNGVFRNTEVERSVIDMSHDLFGHGEVGLPVELDNTAAYLLGSNNTLLAAELQRIGTPMPEGFVVPEAPVTITLYPASKLPAANIAYDVFDLIIDPASYTQADLQYFADRGVTPAVKNSDGSYTIKSQLTIPLMG